jgi:hypothetical protein
MTHIRNADCKAGALRVISVDVFNAVGGSPVHSIGVAALRPSLIRDELAAWTEARQQMKVTDVRVTEIQIVRWQYITTGMMPVALASASLR